MKTVFISGASSGIGEALAEEFARNQYRLVLTARNREKLLQMKGNLQTKYHMKVIVFVADLSKKEERLALCRKIEEKRIVVDVAINNAGSGLSGDFLEQSEEKIEEMMRLNMEALTMLTKFFLNHINRKQKGTIINIASTGAYHPGPYTSVYYATKAYVLSFTEAIARENKNGNIQIIAVCPGAVRTRFAERAGRRDNFAADYPQKIAKHIYRKAMIKKQNVILIGFKYWIWVRVPRKMAAFFIERQQRKLLKNHN